MPKNRFRVTFLVILFSSVAVIFYLNGPGLDPNNNSFYNESGSLNKSNLENTKLEDAKYGRQHIYRDLNNSIDRLLVENTTTMTDLRTTDPIVVNTNSYGLRDEQFPIDKSVNTTRILVIGSSFTFGTGVNSSKIYTEMVERKLNTNFEGRYQFINAGVPGWGVENFYMFLRERGVKFEPDIVVTTLMFNDRFSNQKRESIARKANRQVDQQHPNLTDPNKRLKKVIEHMSELNKREFDQVDPGDSGLRFLQNISQLAGKEGIEDIYYKFGWLDREADSYVQKWISENNKILLKPPRKFYDYCNNQSEECERQDNPYKLAPPWNGDPSIKGHKLLADTLYDGLEQIINRNKAKQLR